MLTLLRARDPALVYVLTVSLDALFATVAWTIAAVYFVNVAHLDPLQLVLLGTTLEVTFFLSEIPTGVFADNWSRRGSVIIGYLLFGVYYIVLGLFPVFPIMVAATLVSGLAFAFVEGAREAWIADELGEERVGPLYLKAAQFSRVFVVIGAAASVGLAATVGLGYTIVVAGGIALALALLLIVAMREDRFTPIKHDDTVSRLRALATTTRLGIAAIRTRPLMLSILLAGALYGAFTEAFDRLWQAHVLVDIGLPAIRLSYVGDLQPITWFAIFTIAGVPIGLAVTEVVRRRLDASDPRSVTRALLVIQVLLIGGIVGFGVALAFPVAAVSYLAVGVLRGLHEPLYAAWLNRGLEPATRATVLSMASQADALGQLGGGPILGLIGSTAGIRASLVSSAVFLVPAALLYVRAVRRHAPIGSTALPSSREQVS